MEGREEMVIVAEGGRSGKSASNLTEAIGSPVREAQGKLSQMSCLSPGSVSYSRDRTELLMDESARPNLCAGTRLHGTPSSGEKHRTGHQHKDGSSSDSESDFYEEIDVSCTPESLDYPTAKGGFRLQQPFMWLEVATAYAGKDLKAHVDRAETKKKKQHNRFLLNRTPKCVANEMLFWLATTLLRCRCCRTAVAGASLW